MKKFLQNTLMPILSFVIVSPVLASSETNNGEDAYAIHWKTPDNWQAEGFDYSHWSLATSNNLHRKNYWR
jgi:hypothetical protein